MTAVATVPLRTPLYRGQRRLRIALVGMPNAGKSTLFNAVASTAPNTAALKGRPYGECTVQVGLDEASVVDLPSISSVHDLVEGDLAVLKYLLWGDDRPPIIEHDANGAAPLSAPDVIIQVVDATRLESHLKLTLELSQLGRPLVVALNMMDVAWEKGLYVNVAALSTLLGIPLLPVVALMGKGISELFAVAVNAVRDVVCPLPQPLSQHVAEALQPLNRALNRHVIHAAFRVPQQLLLTQYAAGEPNFEAELQQHFPQLVPEFERLRTVAAAQLPRPIAEELRADRHHRAATLYEAATRLGPPHAGRGWAYWLDEFFLHPQWGLIGSLFVFAAVLFVVFHVSAWLDSQTAGRLVTMISDWLPHSTPGVIGRAVADGLIGLVGIVVPYMIPLVLLLVALEEAGVMQRIAFVVDRGFHKIGLHGGVAVPFLLGLGCNVPAISACGKLAAGRERLIASVLMTFVPCSARSAIILALAGKYLGGAGVFAVFALTMVVIALLGRLLARHPAEAGPGQVQEIPPYAVPAWRNLVRETWARTEDILTIVTPLLVGGSVVLALLNHIGADAVINVLFMPITTWWLGLPAVLGVPILFGILRKELSLLMIYQALGTFEIGGVLTWTQIATFLLFLTFYIPCISTFAVMLRTLGRKQAVFSVALSVGVALVVSGVVRIALESLRYFTA